MTLKITEELLIDLGFVQQNPPHIWDYKLGNEYHHYRFSKGADYWMFSFNGEHAVAVPDLMAAIRVIEIIAHDKGIQETQDKLHEGLGLDRLLERALDRFREQEND